jgi:hypothetical protein
MSELKPSGHHMDPVNSQSASTDAISGVKNRMFFTDRIRSMSVLVTPGQHSRITRLNFLSTVPRGPVRGSQFDILRKYRHQFLGVMLVERFREMGDASFDCFGISSSAVGLLSRLTKSQEKKNRKEGETPSLSYELRTLQPLAFLQLSPSRCGCIIVYSGISDFNFIFA